MELTVVKAGKGEQDSCMPKINNNRFHVFFGRLLLVPAVFLATAFLNGCVTAKNALSYSKANNAVLLPVKFRKQEPDKCGVAVLSSVFEFFNIDYSEMGKIYSEDEKGTKLITLVNYSDEYITTSVIRASYEEMVKIILQGKPLIIMQKTKSGFHYSVVKGFMKNERKIIVNNGYRENIILSLAANGDTANVFTAVVFGEKKGLPAGGDTSIYNTFM